MELEIEPGHSIGPVRFGCRIEDLMGQLALHEDESEFDGMDQWSWYSNPSRDLLLQTCNGAVVTVICERQCTYRGRGLIGMPEPEIRMLFADTTVAASPVPELEMLEVPELELQFGLSSGRVESVTIGVDPDAVLGQFPRPAAGPEGD